MGFAGRNRVNSESIKESETVKESIVEVLSALDSTDMEALTANRYQRLLGFGEFDSKD